MTPSTHVCYNNYVSITSILEEPTTIPGPHIQRSLCIQWLITWPLASATYCQFYYIRSSVCLSVLLLLRLLQKLQHTMLFVKIDRRKCKSFFSVVGFLLCGFIFPCTVAQKSNSSKLEDNFYWHQCF